MSAVDELVAFVRARLDERERVAKAAVDLAETADWWASAEGMVCDANAEGYRNLLAAPETAWSLDEIGEHIALNDPAAVLADVAAKRAIMELHTVRRRRLTLEAEDGGTTSLSYYVCQVCVPDRVPHGHDFAEGPCMTVRLVGQTFAGGDGYREEWRP